MENLLSIAFSFKMRVIGIRNGVSYEKKRDEFGEDTMKYVTEATLRSIYSTPHVNLIAQSEGSWKIEHSVSLYHVFQNLDTINSSFDDLKILEIEAPALVSNSFRLKNMSKLLQIPEFAQTYDLNINSQMFKHSGIGPLPSLKLSTLCSNIPHFSQESHLSNYIDSLVDNDPKKNDVEYLIKELSLDEKLSNLFRSAFSKECHITPKDWIDTQLSTLLFSMLSLDITSHPVGEPFTILQTITTVNSNNNNSNIHKIPAIILNNQGLDIAAVQKHVNINTVGDEKLWFHGTNLVSVEDICNVGVRVAKCKPFRDFGPGPAFYVTPTFGEGNNI
jgi:hypothetical protein